MPFVYLLALLPFYLLGAFPTGILVAKAYGVSITEKGSGNVGATNVARVVGRNAGLLTLLIDCLKGALAVGLASLFWGDDSLVCVAGVAAVAGHCFSIPGVFKGGKGVATSLGVVTAVLPYAGLAGVLMFLATFIIGRIVSLASIVAALGVPIAAIMITPRDDISASFCIIGLIVVYRHRENIERLIMGTEKRFTVKESPPAA